MGDRFIIVSIGPPRHPQTPRSVERELRRHGPDCHVLQHTWIVKTKDDPAAIFEGLQKVLPPDERFIVAPLSDPWIHHNAKSRDDCSM